MPRTGSLIADTWSSPTKKIVAVSTRVLRDLDRWEENERLFESEDLRMMLCSSLFRSLSSLSLSEGLVQAFRAFQQFLY